MLLVAVFMFIPCLTVFAEPTEINEIRISSDKTYVTLDEQLTAFTTTSDTTGINIKPYGGSTGWAYAYTENNWSDLGNNVTATDTKAHYGLKLGLDIDSKYYYLGSSPTIYLNDEVVSGYSCLTGETLYIDLGYPQSSSQPEEPTYYNVSVNVNGATWTAHDYEETYSEFSVASNNNVLTVSCKERYYLKPPKLKEFNGWEINGVRYAPGETYEVTGDITIKYLWKDAETKDYTVEDEDTGIIFEFTEVADKEFELGIDLLSRYTDEFIEEEWNDNEEAKEYMKEYIKTIKEALTEQTKDLGTYIDAYIIDLYAEAEGRYTEGPFKIRIKMTDEMKKYNTFKMVNVKELGQNEDPEITDEVIELTVNGDYIEGTLDHLSTYVLVGSVVEEKNPSTNDSLILYVILSLLSVVGIVSARKILKNS